MCVSLTDMAVLFVEQAGREHHCSELYSRLFRPQLRQLDALVSVSLLLSFSFSIRIIFLDMRNNSQRSRKVRRTVYTIDADLLPNSLLTCLTKLSFV